ncbi:response regulator [Methanobacterium veterum]|uniref:Response regulator n=1 Tax=Methanobacterium veterum TaxID=408577 RepID=A0A9E5A6M3_9EURY|nr:response regulator [Methanobacterium veterum]MCZ3373496.1 response regulator [Methanobacterium veterum]
MKYKKVQGGVQLLGDYVEILLVEDNAADVRLINEIFKDFTTLNKMHVVNDGIAAMDFLHKKGEYKNAPRPDLVLLDLNLPRKDGREVLVEIKEDENLKSIPVIILTTSSAPEDISETYNYANSFITKPANLDSFIKVLKSLEDFWIDMIKQSS